MNDCVQYQFARAVVPPTVRLAGRVLGPMTIGHQILLARVRSPFSTGVEREPSVGDVAMAWYILTRPWTSARDGIGTRRSRWEITWFTVRRAGRHIADAAALSQWISESSQIPPYTQVDDEVEETDADEPGRGAPTTLILAQAVASEWNIAWPEVLNIPVAQANWLWASKWEERGRITINGEQSSGVQDAVRRLADPTEAERRAQLNAAYEARMKGETGQ